MTTTHETSIYTHCRTLDLVANTPEWELERRNGFGASDMSTVLGLNPWEDWHSLWMQKVWGVQPAVNWRMRIGHALEPIIREKFEEDTRMTVEQHPMVQSLSHPFIRYTPDGFTDDGGLFEAKSTTWLLAHQWADEQTADHAEIQVQAGMFVTGKEHAWVAAMIDADPDRLEIRRVERDQEFIDHMIEVAEHLWVNYILAEVEPPLTALSLDWIKQEFSEADEDSVDIGDDGLTLYQQMKAAKEAAKAAETLAAEKEAQLRQLVGNKGVVMVGDRKIGTRKKITQRRLDQQKLIAAGLDPDEYKTESSYTRFYFSKGA